MFSPTAETNEAANRPRLAIITHCRNPPRPPSPLYNFTDVLKNQLATLSRPLPLSPA